MKRNIGIIVGSLRKDSYNRKIAEEIIDLLPVGYKGELVEVGNLPFYNEDLDGDVVAEEYTKFRDKLDKYDAFIFLSPEYNRSYAPAIKNALDIGSRPFNANKWAGKAAAVFTASPSGMGGMAANHHLKQVLGFLDMKIMNQPEVFLAKIAESFKDGSLVEASRDFLKQALEAFIKHIENTSIQN